MATSPARCSKLVLAVVIFFCYDCCYDCYDSWFSFDRLFSYVCVLRFSVMIEDIISYPL